MENTENVKPEPSRGRVWLKVLKWLAGIAGGLVALVVILSALAVWILTPERLTPLVEKYGSEFIDGRINVKRVELTYWRTFPRLQVDVDSLNIISHSLHKLPAEQRRQLPAGSDSLLSVARFSGGINLLDLLIGRIGLYDIEISNPKAMLVDVAPGVSNYNIFPEDETPDTAAVVIPDFRFSRFVLQGDAPIRYVSLPDTIDARVTLSSVSADGNEAPTYTVSCRAEATTRLAAFELDSLRLGASGDILWNHSEPYRITLRKFEAGINNVRSETDVTLSFDRRLTIESLLFNLPDARLREIINIIPAEMRGELDKVKSELTFNLKARLLKPWMPAAGGWPSAEVSLTIPDGTLTYEELDLRKLTVDLNATIDGERPDASTVELKRLVAIGRGVGFELSGTARDLLKDPMVEGHFKGGVEFARLPRKLMAQTGCNVSGSLRADATFHLRQSWLSREQFHRVNAAGEATLTNFHFGMPEMDITAFIRKAELNLGTSSKFVHEKVSADSLLTVSLKVDTLSAALPGMTAEVSDLLAGIGCRNTAASADTTRLHPIGVVLRLGRFKFLDTSDSSRIRLRDVKAHATLKRFRDSNREPLLNVGFDARRMRYSDRVNRANLREATVALTLHPAVRKSSGRMAARIDSLRRIYPTLSEDSLRSMARSLRKNRRADTAPSGSTTMDYGVDDETRSMLRKWRAEGTLKAARARVFTPYFPLKNTLRDIDLRFNNDSLTVNTTRYTVGRSDFLIDGSVTNITKAVTSRSGRQPLRINLRLTSDTIDVNQLAAAVFAGAAFAEKERQGAMIAIADSDDDNIIQQSIAAQADSTASGPLLIPTNVEAVLRLNARNVIYSDFLFRNLRGNLEVADGVLNMRNLSARTDIGSVDLTALYEGIDPESLSFAFGMNVRDFHVGRFLNLVPALDTIMPLLKDMSGIINGQIAAHTLLDSTMDLRIPSLSAAVSLQGDSLVLLDPETYRSIGKWLLFKDKQNNVIDSMTVKLVVKDSKMQLYPFIFNIDRYRLGVYGNNDMDLNLRYHIAVLKSPIPFKFGINVSGTPDKMKVRLGGPKWDSKSATSTFAIADTTRINLVNQIQGLFRRGVSRSREPLNLILDNSPAAGIRELETISGADTISHSDSLIFIREGLLPAPPLPETATPAEPVKKQRRKK